MNLRDALSSIVAVALMPFLAAWWIVVISVIGIAFLVIVIFGLIAFLICEGYEASLGLAENLIATVKRCVYGD